MLGINCIGSYTNTGVKWRDCCIGSYIRVTLSVETLIVIILIILIVIVIVTLLLVTYIILRYIIMIKGSVEVR